MLTGSRTGHQQAFGVFNLWGKVELGRKLFSCPYLSHRLTEFFKT